MSLLCSTVVVPDPTLLSNTLTPFPTIASEELTMLTPFAPINAVPARLTDPVAEVVTLELFAAIEPPDTVECVALARGDLIHLAVAQGLLCMSRFRCALAKGSAANQNRSGDESAKNPVHLELSNRVICEQTRPFAQWNHRCAPDSFDALGRTSLSQGVARAHHRFR